MDLRMEDMLIIRLMVLVLFNIPSSSFNVFQQRRLASGQLQVNLPAALRATPGTRTVYVRNNDGQLASATFAVTRVAAPMVNVVVPASTTANSQAFRVRLDVSGLFSNAQTMLNGVPVGTETLSTGERAVIVPAGSNIRGGVVQIRFQNSDGQSTTAAVRITPRPAPFAQSVRIVPDGANGFVVSITGTGFWGTPTVMFAGEMLRVMSVSPTQVVVRLASLPAQMEPAPALELVNEDGQGTGLRVGRDAVQLSSQGTGQGNAQGNLQGRAATGHSAADMLIAGGERRFNAASTPMLALSVYPNPATDEIIVESGLESAQVRVLNTLGAVVAEGRLASGLVRFAVQNWSAGSYTVEVFAGSQRVVKRFVKY